MPSADEPVAHVERTADPEVMRWRCSSPSLAGLPDGVRHPDDPAWAAFDGAVVEVRGGVVEVRLADAGQWARDAQPIHAAMLDAFRRRTGWLFDAVVAVGASSVPLDSLQLVVDRAAGAITGAHGGTITVVGVDGGLVTLRLSGACHGCRFTDDTVERVIGPALRLAFPHLRVAIER